MHIKEQNKNRHKKYIKKKILIIPCITKTQKTVFFFKKIEFLLIKNANEKKKFETASVLNASLIKILLSVKKNLKKTAKKIQIHHKDFFEGF